MKRTFLIVMAMMLLVSLAFAQESAEEEKPTLILVENPWTASTLNVNVAKILLERELGYEVEIILLDESAQWAALATGDAHVSLEVWPSGHQDNVEEYINELEMVVYGGELGPVGKIGWFIPTYLVEAYPELATWEGFADPELAALFATAETGEKGQFLAGAPGWTQYDEQIIENLDLNLEVVYAGSEEAILASVTSSYRREDPVLFYFWTPHSVHAEYDLTNVALPEYSEECYEDADAIDCDYPEDVLFKIFWAGLEEVAPDAYLMLSNMNYTSEAQIEMIAAVEVEGLTVEEVAEAWVEENEEVWSEWFIEKTEDEISEDATEEATEEGSDE